MLLVPLAYARIRAKGGGVPPEQRERIFEPFYRLPGASERAGGVGLGLSLTFGSLRRLNLAYGATAMLAAYLGAWLHIRHQAPAWLVALTVVASATLIGLYVERLCFAATRDDATVSRGAPIAGADGREVVALAGVAVGSHGGVVAGSALGWFASFLGLIGITLGVLGGGQLGRMFAIAARRMDYSTLGFIQYLSPTIVFFLGLFTLLTQFFTSQSLATAGAVLVGMLGLLTALVNAHRPAGRPALAGSAWLATRLMLAKQSGMEDAELAKAMSISVEDVPLAIDRAREVTTLINPKKVRALRQAGAADTDIAREIGWRPDAYDPQDLRSALDTLERKAIKAEPPPVSNGFGGGKGPPKPLANGLAGKGPPQSMSRAAIEATRELKAARSAYNRASQKWVMKDDRELRVKPLEDRVVEAEANLARVLKNDARLKTAGARVKSMVRSPNLLVPVGGGVAGAAIGLGGVVALNSLSGKKEGPKPPNPRDPDFYWNEIVTKDSSALSAVQLALADWGVWPEDQDVTGGYGKITKAAIKRWRADRGLDADAPMTKADVERLLAGPRGYQDKQDRSWRRGDQTRPELPR